MTNKLKLFTLFLALLFPAVFLSACQANSPITTAKNFLDSLKKGNYQQAADFLLVEEIGENSSHLRVLNQEEKIAWEERIKKNLGNISVTEVQNSVPINDAELKKFNIAEGYEIFFHIDSQNQGPQNLKGNIFKINNSWKILTSNL